MASDDALGTPDPYDDGLGSQSELTQDEVDEQARQHLMDTSLGFQRILLPEGASRADAIYYISQQIPTNEYQLPTFFYRSDLLPHNLGSMTQDDVDSAAVTLYYDEGYPTFGKTKAQIFWMQLPHEPLEAYGVFRRYLEQAEDIGLRQLQLLALDENLPLERISSWALEYYWGQRSRAYDLFQVAAERKKREMRVRRTEDKHFKIAESLIQDIQNMIAEQGETFYRNLTPAEALRSLKDLVSIQRISMGEHQNGRQQIAGVSDVMAGASGADLMRDLTKNIAQGSSATGIDSNLRLLMSDPNFAMQAQSLIIQVRRGTEAPTGIDMGSAGGQPNGSQAKVIEGTHKVIQDDA